MEYDETIFHVIAEELTLFLGIKIFVKYLYLI